MNKKNNLMASPKKTKKVFVYKRLLKEVVKNKAFFLMMLPGMLILFINNYLPMFGIVIAFKNLMYRKEGLIQSIITSKWVGLTNFKYFIQGPDALITTRNTVVYNAVFIILNLLISVALAVALNEVINRRRAKFYQTVMFLPYFLSWVVVAYIGYAFLSIDLGLINSSILKPLGIAPVEWYFEPKYWVYILPLVNVWKYAGYSCVLYLAAITGIDSQLYEAATIDGAGKWRQLTDITLPLLKPLMIILTIMAIGRIFNSDFGLFFQMPMDSGPLLPTTNVIDTYVYRTLLKSNDVGLSSAAGLYQSIIGFILVLAANLVIKKISPEDAIF